MNTDIQDALSSVAEVAIFAWSLLELLLTRILPLAGFLAGHLLLQFGSLLSSVVTTPAASRRRRPRASEYSYSWDEVQAVDEEVIEEGDNVHVVKEDEHSWDLPQAEELAQEAEEKVPVVKEEDDDHQNSSESLKSSDEEHGEISPQVSGKKASVLPSLPEDEEADAAATTAEAALPKTAPPEEHVTVFNDSGNQTPARGSNEMDVAEPSDAQKIELSLSETPGKHVNEDNKPFNLNTVGVEEGHVSSNTEVSEGKIDLKPSHTETGEEVTSAAPRAGEMRKMSGEGAEMRKSSSNRGSRSILRVLPTSRSQVERILRQRSRRVSFSHAED